jgi:hypothetical protein
VVALQPPRARRRSNVLRHPSPLLALAAVLLVGCGFVDWSTATDPPIVQVEAWNRTLDDVFLVDADGRLISIPACGHAEAAPLAVANAELRMDAGRISTLASRGVGNPQYLVVVAGPGASVPSKQRPVSLPACAGHPTVVPPA